MTTDRSAERGPSRRICARAVDSILRLGPGSAARLKSRLVRGDKIAVVSSGDETRRARSASAASPLDSVRGNEDWTRETHHEWWATKADKFRQVLRTAYGGTCDQPVCNCRRKKSGRSRKPKTCRNEIVNWSRANLFKSLPCPDIGQPGLIVAQPAEAFQFETCDRTVANLMRHKTQQLCPCGGMAIV